MSGKRAKQKRRDDLAVYTVNEVINKMREMGFQWYHQDGKMMWKSIYTPNKIWFWGKHHPEVHCRVWRRTLYKLACEVLPEDKHFIPEPCQECYKAVIRPSTYEGLLKTYELVRDMGYPAKCGIEIREAVDALYGAYFYCRGIEEGLDRLDEIKKHSNEKAVFLKRGCTGFERKFGPSDKWEIKPWQLAIEEEFYRRVDIENPIKQQDEEELKNLFENWEKFAEEVGPDYEPSHNYVTYTRKGPVYAIGKTPSEELKQKKKDFNCRLDIRVRIYNEGQIEVLAPPFLEPVLEAMRQAAELMVSNYPDQAEELKRRKQEGLSRQVLLH